MVPTNSANPFGRSLCRRPRLPWQHEDSLGLWDEADKFYYDELRTPDRRKVVLKVRSMVNLVPLFAVEVLDPSLLAKLPSFTSRMQ